MSKFILNLKPTPIMSRAMFEYTKVILQKVSFDPLLFFKELDKAISRLLPYELEELKVWLDQFVLEKPELSKSLIYIKV